MVGLVGEPESCKSTLALQVGYYNVKQGIPVYLIDLENGELLTEERLLCHVLGCSSKRLRMLDFNKIGNVYKKLMELPFYYANEVPTFDSLEQDVAELAATAKDKMLIIIDSLQSLWTKADNIRTMVDEWLIFFDSLKLKYDERLVILLTIEKRRGTYKEACQDAGKESGRIEYKLGQQLDLRTNDDNSNIIVTCTKNRYGAKGGNFILNKNCEQHGNFQTFTFSLTEVAHEIPI